MEQSLLYVGKSIFKYPDLREYQGIQKLRPHLHSPFNYIQLHGLECLYTPTAAKFAAKEDMLQLILDRGINI